LYNIVFALAAFPLGALADKIGIRKVFLSGLLLFAVVYFLFASAPSAIAIYVAFVLYGIYAAATEGITKAWITNLSHDQNTATAIGFYTSCESICTLFASVLAGWLWGAFGSSTTFTITGCMALAVFVYFLLLHHRSAKGAAILADKENRH
jgi:MFS family permease